jgi:hypothetical protein
MVIVHTFIQIFKYAGSIATLLLVFSKKVKHKQGEEEFYRKIGCISSYYSAYHSHHLKT